MSGGGDLYRQPKVREAWLSGPPWEHDPGYSPIFLIPVSLWIVIQDLNFQNIPFTIPNDLLILVLTVSSQGGRLDLLLACWFLALTRMFLVLMSAQPKP